MLDDLLGAAQPNQEIGWFWQLKQLPDQPESRYLYTLLADNDFQEGLKNYRDLGFLSGTLDRWGGNLDAYHDMIDSRRLAYADRLPRTDALLASNMTTGMLAERAAIETRLNAIETGADVAALGSPKEQLEWEKIRQLEAAATDSANPDHTKMVGERDKIKLMKGVLFWELDARFKERNYTERRELRALDAQLNEAQNRWVRVQKARASICRQHRGISSRITELAAHIVNSRESWRNRRSSSSSTSSSSPARLCLEQKDRLAEYQVQARFAPGGHLRSRQRTPPREPIPRRPRTSRRRTPQRARRRGRPRVGRRQRPRARMRHPRTLRSHEPPPASGTDPSGECLRDA